ncbi:diguanylate cyclase [Sulfurovum sp.]|uniref:GGDEF domain-containing protein n=1 Tax=Sulfurovum sp. TaxID=1969726 RepID=UPI002620EC2B|nr:diguanylate cyclase [Sulfurovum sp.]
MKQDLSTYRITLLLYLGVLLLPFSFYYTYSSMQNLASDTTAIKQVSQTGGDMLAFVATSDQQTKKQIQLKIDKNLKELGLWITSNNKKEFYVGGRTLQKDFNRLKQQWNTLKKNPDKPLALKEWKAANSLSFTIDKMLLLKQDKMSNIFYINIIGAMVFLLLLIYFTRMYIQQQIKKHAIYDYDTHLFNQKYFLARLHTAVERAKRENTPLAILFLSINNFTDDTYNEKQQKHLLQKVGHILATATRDSDTVCRYDDNHFAVLMSQTKKEQGSPLKKRLKSGLESYDFELNPKPVFHCDITQFEMNESEESFVKRSRN